MPKPIDFNTQDNRGQPRDGDELLHINREAHKAKMDFLKSPSKYKDDPVFGVGVPDFCDEPEPYVPVKLLQSDYNAIVEHARTHGKTVINIPRNHDTEHLSLAMDIPHNFHGFNYVRDVPEGSYIGDGSAIAPDVTVRNCSIGACVLVGDFCKLIDCKIGTSCQAGEGVVMEGCEVQLLLEAKSILANNTIIMGMGDIDKLTVTGDCVVYPGVNVDELLIHGENNVLGDDDLAIPENAHKSNVCLRPEFTQSNVYNFEPEFIEAKPGSPPTFSSVREGLKPFINNAIRERAEQDVTIAPRPGV